MIMTDRGRRRSFCSVLCTCDVVVVGGCVTWTGAGAGERRSTRESDQIRQY